MRKKLTRVTFDEKKLINALTLAGVPQKSIAAQVGLPRNTVSGVQRVLGISPRPSRDPLPESLVRKILTMAGRSKHGAPFIARELGLKTWQVSAVFEERRNRMTPGQVGAKYYLGEREFRAMRRKRRTFERELAREFRISESRARRFNRSTT
jgi:hypothetical protein